MASAKTSEPTEVLLLRISKVLSRLPFGAQSLIASSFNIAPYLILVFALWLSISSYWNILPGIFQDEYVYSMGARKLGPADQPYPNYLFSFLFQATNACGLGFYQCGKALNSVFLLVFVALVYGISRLLHSRNVSLILSAVAAVSPVTVFASFFMPEMLFFTLNLLAVFVLLLALNNRTTINWLALSVVLALALLTKRHELFLLPGFALAIFLLLPRGGRQTLRALMTAIGFALVLPILIRQFVVFLLTGNPFPSILGSTYGRSFRDSVGGSSGGSDRGPAQSTLSIFDLLSQGTWHLIFHLAVLAIFGLAFLQISKANQDERVITVPKAVQVRHRLSIVVLSIAMSIVPVVTFFESYLTLIGDNHSFRLLGRYYEFLFVLLLIVSVSYGSNWQGRRKKGLIVTITTISFVIFVTLIGPFINTGPSDSMIIHGLMLIGPWILLFLIGFLLSAVKFVNKLGLSPIIISLLVPSLLLATGLAVRSDLDTRIGTNLASVDIAGLFVADSFPDAEGERILVIGRNRVEVTATKFWIDQPGVTHSIQPEGPRQIARKRLAEVDYIIALLPSALITKADVELIFEYTGFRVFIVNRP